METNASILVHRGKCKQFNLQSHVSNGFSGNRTENVKRSSLYRCYNAKIKEKFLELKCGIFQETVDRIIRFLPNNDNRVMNAVAMVAVMFSDGAPAVRRGLFDAICEDERVSDFRLARLKTGTTAACVETLIAQMVGQVLDTGESRGNLQTLLSYWKENETGDKSPGILVLLEDILSFDSHVLYDLLILLHSYKSIGLPVTVIAGFPQSNSPSCLLPHALLRKYSLKTVTVSMDNVVKELLHFISSPTNIPFQLSPKSLQLLISSVTENAATCDDVLAVLQLIMLEHFGTKSGSTYCLALNELKQMGNSVKRHWLALEAAEYCRGYWLGRSVLFELLRLTMKDLPRLDVHLLSICVAADDDFFQSDRFSDSIRVLSSLETEKIVDFISACQDLMEQDHVLESVASVGNFKLNLGKLKDEFMNIEERQAKRETKTNPVSSESPEVKKRLRKSNPNPKLGALQQQLSEKISQAKESDVLSAMRKEMFKTLNDFLRQTLISPPENAISTMVFDDTDFVRHLLLSSSRKILADALSSPYSRACFHFYEDSSHRIELGEWFEEFRKVSDDDWMEQEEESSTAASFYKMLSSLEYIGFVSKDRKKDIVQIMDANAHQPDANLTRTLKRLLICSLTIIGLPLVSLFIAKRSIFENLLHFSSEDSFLYAAIAAVVLVHLVLAAFVYTAWTESALPPPLHPELEKQD